MPGSTPAGTFVSVTVAKYVTTLLTSVELRSTLVTVPAACTFGNALLELLDDEEDDDVLPVEAPDVVDPAVADTPPPETVWPTTPFTAVTTPSAGACRVVQPIVCSALSACACACASDAWAAARSLGCSC